MSNEPVGQALEEWIESLPCEDQEGPGVLGDWIAVVCMVDVDESGHPRAQYYVTMRNGNMLPHMAAGLLQRGIDELDRMTE